MAGEAHRRKASPAPQGGGAPPQPGHPGGALQKIAGGIQQGKAIEAAQRMQQMMLPELPKPERYEFAWAYHPADHVSGDFCDIVDLSGGRFGLLIGDVSGHGIEAGMIMGMAKKALQIYARAGGPPADVLSTGNDDLRRDLDAETFLTAVYGVLDTGRNSMEFVRAGHTHPILFGPDAGSWQVLKSGGMMIGASAGNIFRKSLQTAEVPLEKGQVLLLYTDGAIEAHERGGNEFGMDRLLEYLDPKCALATPLAGVLDGLVEELRRWFRGTPQEDDITLLAVRRNE